MPLSMHQASAAAFDRGLTALANVLRKGVANAAERKIDDRILVEARLYPDMLPLRTQVHIATDFARGTLDRLRGEETAKWDDNEATLAELAARVERALELVRSVDAASLAGSETRETVRKVGGNDRTFTGADYLTQYALPNFYFHVTTAYDILRHNGVPLGKADYIGAFT